MKLNFRLGSDPEIFLLNQSKELVSCIGKVDGNKWNPLQVDYLPKGFTLQQDNVALEFGIPPAANKKEFIQYIQTVLKAGKDHLEGLSYSSSSCEVFPEQEMQTAEAHIFGCEPDYNAWTGRKNPSPKPPHPYMRSAGGHVHVETKLPQKAVVRALDLTLGLRSLLWDKAGETRRQLYGKAGAYRKKSYGPEYRTLSNFWIMSKAHTGRIWDGTAEALQMVQSGVEVVKDVRKAIDTNDVPRAKEILSYYGMKV